MPHPTEGRDDARARASGAARYVGDLSLPGMLPVGLVRGPVPHAHRRPRHAPRRCGRRALRGQARLGPLQEGHGRRVGRAGAAGVPGLRRPARAS